MTNNLIFWKFANFPKSRHIPVKPKSSSSTRSWSRQSRKLLYVTQTPSNLFIYFQETREVKVWVEKVFRGKKYDKIISIETSSKTPDFKLLSKKEEAEYCKLHDREEKIIAPFMDLPPLLREFIEKETGRKDIKMKVHHKEAIFNSARLAKDGEKPNLEISIGIGKPHPKAVGLYEGLSI